MQTTLYPEWVLRNIAKQFAVRSGNLRSTVIFSFWLLTLTIFLNYSLSVSWHDYCYWVWFILSLGWWAVGCSDGSMPLKPCLVEQSRSEDCSLLSYKSSAHTVLCNWAHVVLSKWGKRLLIPIEMKLHEGKFAVGKGRKRQEIVLVWFFP